MKKIRVMVGVLICGIVWMCNNTVYASKNDLCVPSCRLPADQDPDDDQDPGVIKITKAFAVNGSDKVILNNQYGTLNIRTWNKNEVRLDVVVYGSPELEAHQLSDMVVINSLKKDGAVLLETRLTGGKRKSGKKIRVEFHVYMPETNSLMLSHQYGDVKMGDFKGSVVARLQYGNFTAGALRGSNNDLAISYGSTVIRNIGNAKISQEYGDGLTIGTAGTLSLNAAYAAVKINTITDKAVIKQEYGAGLTIGSVGQLDLDAAYADVQIGSIRGAAKIYHQYSDLNIGTANGLYLDAQYSNVNIDRLNDNAKLYVQYNKLSIGEVGSGCQSLTVECSYVKTAIKFSNNYHAGLDAATGYSTLSYGPGISLKVEENAQEKRYSGKIGSGGSSRVKLVSRYGSIMVN